MPVTLHDFDAFLSYPIRATLEVLEPDRMQLRCLMHSFAKPTGPGGIITDLVRVDDGDVDRAAGRGALIDGLATPVTVLRARNSREELLARTQADFTLMAEPREDVIHRTRRRRAAGRSGR